jgi:hypothetical protein
MFPLHCMCAGVLVLVPSNLRSDARIRDWRLADFELASAKNPIRINHVSLETSALRQIVEAVQHPDSSGSAIIKAGSPSSAHVMGASILPPSARTSAAVPRGSRLPVCKRSRSPSSPPTVSCACSSSAAQGRLSRPECVAPCRLAIGSLSRGMPECRAALSIVVLDD